jgi:hypothetical protein
MAEAENPLILQRCSLSLVLLIQKCAQLQMQLAIPALEKLREDRGLASDKLVRIHDVENSTARLHGCHNVSCDQLKLID